MKLTDFGAKAVTTALEQVSERFHTRDVSEHRAMLAAHGEGTGSNYQTMVGSYLSQNRGDLGLRLLPEDESREARAGRRPRARRF